MDAVPRGADVRRLFTAELKRQQIDRVLRGEVTVTELSRELGITRSLIQCWKHLATKGAEAAVGANSKVAPVSELHTAQARIRELERLIGKQTVEVEILRAARDEARRRPHWYGASKPGRADRSR